MKITKKQLQFSANSAGVSDEQVEKIWENLQRSGEERDYLKTIFYWIGAFIMVMSLAVFTLESWSSDSSAILGVVVSLIYAALGLFFGRKLWKNPRHKTLGGLLIGIAVCTTPVFVKSLQRLLNIPNFESLPIVAHLYDAGCVSCGSDNLIYALLATMFIGFTAIYFFRFPFLISIPLVSILVLLPSLTPILFFTPQSSLSIGNNQILFMCVGAAYLITFFLLEKKFNIREFAFWGYLWGFVGFYSGAHLFVSTDIQEFILFLISLFFIFFSFYNKRKIFFIFGIFGSIVYLTDLISRYLSLNLPIVISLVGILIICCAFYLDDLRKFIKRIRLLS